MADRDPRTTWEADGKKEGGIAATSAPEGRSRILMIAYACDPGEGSEEGTGWIWARMLAGVGDTWVLTRPSGASGQGLAEAFEATPEGPAIHVVTVEAPGWVDRIRIGGKPPRRLVNVVWQIRALRVARRLQRTQGFDLVWHVTWSAGWLGSLGWAVGPPFVWGPIGVGVGPPWRLVPSLGISGAISEVARVPLRRLSRFLNPLVWMSLARASLILTQNGETSRWVPQALRSKAVVFNHVVLDDSVDQRDSVAPPDRAARRHAVFVGRLLSWKGAHLAIEALSDAPSWSLSLFGTGPDEGRLRSTAKRVGVQDRVRFEGLVPRSELLRTLREEASVMVFPSLHDEGGWVVQEALSFGVPVICLDRGGPLELGGTGVPTSGRAATVRRLAEAMETIADHPVDPASVRRLRDRRRALIEIIRQAGLA